MTVFYYVEASKDYQISTFVFYTFHLSLFNILLSRIHFHCFHILFMENVHQKFKDLSPKMNE